MENAANTEMENTPKLMENVAQIPAKAWMLLLIIGLVVFGVIPWQAAAVLIVGGWVVLNRIEAEQRLRDAKARAAGYANLIGPVVVESIDPNETVFEVQARAEKWREQLILSGNPIADKIPIIPFPYQPVLTGVGELTGGWSIYKRLAGERQHNENIKWYSGKCPPEYKALFASAVLPSIKQETEV